jgi:hypothetical protein
MSKFSIIGKARKSFEIILRAMPLDFQTIFKKRRKKTYEF